MRPLRTLVALGWPAIFVALTLAMTNPTTLSAAGGYVPRFSHVMVVVLENQSYEDIFQGNPGATYIRDKLTPASAKAARFYAVKRNSPTAYYALSSGYTHADGDRGGWAGKCGPTLACSSGDVTVYEQLMKAGRAWAVYSEDQLTPCQTTLVAKYWVLHNPAVFYRRLGPNSYVQTGNGSCLQSDVPFDRLGSDIAANSVPDYSLIIPNNCHNMHDSCYPTQDRVLQGNDWLQSTMSGDAVVVGGLIKWAKANDTLIVITFDEGGPDSDRQTCCPYAAKGGGGHIPTWVIGPDAKVKAKAYQSGVGMNTYSILKTVEDNWNLPLLGHAKERTVSDLSDFFILQPAKPGVPPPALGVGGPSATAGASEAVSASEEPAASDSAAASATASSASGRVGPKPSGPRAGGALGTPASNKTPYLPMVVGIVGVAAAVLLVGTPRGRRRPRAAAGVQSRGEAARSVPVSPPRAAVVAGSVGNPPSGGGEGRLLRRLGPSLVSSAAVGESSANPERELAPVAQASASPVEASAPLGDLAPPAASAPLDESPVLAGQESAPSVETSLPLDQPSVPLGLEPALRAEVSAPVVAPSAPAAEPSVPATLQPSAITVAGAPPIRPGSLPPPDLERQRPPVTGSSAGRPVTGPTGARPRNPARPNVLQPSSIHRVHLTPAATRTVGAAALIVGVAALRALISRRGRRRG